MYMRRKAPHSGSVTIRRVAELAGVSVATAARAMGKYGSVSEKTRQRVLDAARELSYVPNAIAKSMRVQRTKTIGVIIGDIQAPFFSKLAFAIEDYANRRDYNVLVCNTNEKLEREIRHLWSLYERRVDGIILSSTQSFNCILSDEVRRLYESEIPLVTVDRQVNGLKRPLVQCNNLGGSYQAGKYLLGLGHRNIGVIASNRFINSTREREAGFRMALAEYNLALKPEMIRYCEESFITEAGRRITKELLDENPDITALYLLNNPLYRSAWLELKARGAHIPEDFSLLGWGDVELAEAWDITAVTQPIQAIGVRAAEILFDMIDHRTRHEDDMVVFDTAIMYRSSCAKPRTL
jgi:DNA-binding LacI/PurR family transcriptional regulator